MDYNNINKDELKEVIKTNAENKEFELPSSWYNLGKENMIALAKEIDDIILEVKEVNKPEVTGAKNMREIILADEKVTVFVPEDQINNTDHVRIWLNGVEFVYAREKEYQMPKCIAEIYNRSRINKHNARKKMREFAEIK